MRIVVEGIQPLVFHVFLLYFHYSYRYVIVIGNGGIIGIIGIVIGIAVPLLLLFLG